MQILRDLQYLSLAGSSSSFFVNHKYKGRLARVLTDCPMRIDAGHPCEYYH